MTATALLTDLYQLGMAQGYWKLGRADQPAVFHLFFREAPFGGGFAIAAGLGPVLDLLRGFAFTADDTDHLARIPGGDGRPLFEAAFLAYLRDLRLTIDLDALPEGTACFAHAPLLRVRGPLLQCQLLETALLNALNFQTLVATKAARVRDAAGGDTVLEFGLRRAQGTDGALAASRAAYLGGVDATSNVAAGKAYGIPVKGTQAHSWVMSFETEREAFAAWADTAPNNGVFLVDTYDSLAGVDHAIEAGRRLRGKGHRLGGVRLDSGDLAWLSREARRRLDAAGFPEAQVVASNDLDEHVIRDLRSQGAAIDVWGVGTQLVTAHDQPALGGVYKLAAIRDAGSGCWIPKVKLSETTAKTSLPGILQVRRYDTAAGGRAAADQLWSELDGEPRTRELIDPTDPIRRRTIAADRGWKDLLEPAVRGGVVVFPDEPLAAARDRARAERSRLDPTVRRLVKPHRYPVGVTPEVLALRQRLIEAAR
ncbi:nicotinate phosphoribosyltransferase [Phycisphaera mikurensis]|uniref:Nicotinate phosphoribosyltransferase n=1 Tax=Phycisphaera mikurensis (strain NBRC 102666 / KCTC 22515 / FYK2301M01) TaxID=1142394 RepID=I0IIW7_PHYMF|nr:nicotinate phosphoribosyltransferase [Phycisphaera mikurensis]MBB6443370.1 nicotinate phosphoribosyltransferase [Phycisphaera mikurensis]BAM05205.1 putative nicotinate phosphoribosyltransferase [Phycisphaera mikurensis NBRC 102666]